MSFLARWVWRKISLQTNISIQQQIAKANDPIDGLLKYIGSTRWRWRFLRQVASRSASKTLTPQLKYHLIFAYLAEETDVAELTLIAQHLNEPRCRAPLDRCPIVNFDLELMLTPVVAACSGFVDIPLDQRIKLNEAFLYMGIGILLIVARRQQEKSLYPNERLALCKTLQALCDGIVTVRRHNVEKLQEPLLKLVDAVIGATGPSDFENTELARSYRVICDEFCHSLKALGEHDFLQWCAAMLSLCVPRDKGTKILDVWNLLDLDSPEHASEFLHRFFDEACTVLLLPFDETAARRPDVHKDARAVASHLHQLINSLCHDSNHHKMWQSSVMGVVNRSLRHLEGKNGDGRLQEHFQSMFNTLNELLPKSDWQIKEVNRIDQASERLKQADDKITDGTWVDPPQLSQEIPASQKLLGSGTSIPSDSKQSSHDEIAKMAFSLWVKKGKPDGEHAARQNWHEAEQIVRESHK